MRGWCVWGRKGVEWGGLRARCVVRFFLNLGSTCGAYAVEVPVELFAIALADWNNFGTLIAGSSRLHQDRRQDPASLAHL